MYLTRIFICLVVNWVERQNNSRRERERETLNWIYIEVPKLLQKGGKKDNLSRRQKRTHTKYLINTFLFLKIKFAQNQSKFSFFFQFNIWINKKKRWNKVFLGIFFYKLLIVLNYKYLFFSNLNFTIFSWLI